MFAIDAYDCPACGMGIAGKLTDGQEIVCSACARRFSVLLGGRTRSVGLVPLDEAELAKPLNLPQGSVRALATFITAGAAWMLILMNRPVPGYLLSLLLTVIAYYFGFRKKAGAAASRIYNAGVKVEQPLFLPAAVIRALLIAGFALCAVALYATGRLWQMQYMEFYAILAGLVAGVIFGRVVRPVNNRLENWVNHVKGLGVLLASAWLAVALMRSDSGQDSYLGLGLACAISFYFGSRS